MFDWYIWKEILACLLVAAILGAILGYLWRWLMDKGKAGELEASWRERFDKLSLDLDGAKAALKAEAGKLAEMTRLHGEVTAQFGDASAKLGEATAKLTGYETELAGLRLKVPQLDADLVAKSAALAAALANFAKCQESGADLTAQLAAKSTELDGLQAELDKLRRELVVRSESEKTLTLRVGELQGLMPKLRDTEAKLVSMTSQKDGEIAKLVAQVATLTPLTAEVAGLSSKVSDWETRYRKLQT